MRLFGIGFSILITRAQAKALVFQRFFLRRMAFLFLIGLAFAVYAAQLAFNRAWLSRFQFGPLEWVWRMLTYGIRMPLRKPQVVRLT